MNVFDQILLARSVARDQGIKPNAVLLGRDQWREVRRSLADSEWPDAMDMSPTRLNIHGLWVRLALEECDVCHVFVYLEVPV